MPENEEPQDPGQQQYPLIIQPEQMAGVWANYARVSHTVHEFTLDFVRLDPTTQQAIVVARVSVSPLFVTQFIDALNANWAKYAEKALPKEVQDAGEGELPDGQGT